MIILSFYQWDAGVGGSWVVGVMVVDSFEFYSIYFSNGESFIEIEELKLVC